MTHARPDYRTSQRSRNQGLLCRIEGRSPASAGSAGSRGFDRARGAARVGREAEAATEDGLSGAAYQEFLRSKVILAPERGMEPGEMNPALKPHARDIAKWMIRGGNRACFASYGLHKTSIQLQVCESLLDAGQGDSALIVCPLGVRREFVKEQVARGFRRVPVYVATDDEHARARDAGATLFLTNYERIRNGQLDPRRFAVASLDEASVLRSFGSDTYQEFLPLFADVPFKFVATATPSPNRLKELIHYAAFLGVMDSGLALTRFFKRDSTKAGNLTLHPHKVREFRLWCATWAVFIEKPSDLGCSDDGYILPDIEFVRHRLPVDYSTAGFDSWGQGKLVRDAAAGLSEAAREKRDSLIARVQRAKEIVESDPNRTWIIWHELEDEWRALKAAIPGFEHITGSGMTIEEREQIVGRFADGDLRIFGTKPKLSGSGSNFQDHCYSNIFMSLTYKANDFMQALHRTQRFGQKHKVEAHLVYTESEDPVHDELMRKIREHNELHSAMAAITHEYGLNSIAIGSEMQRAIVNHRTEFKGDLFTVVNSDCVLETARLPENSVGLVVTSIPFGNHYEYCEAYNDMGHTQDDAHFFAQMDFLTPELYRSLKPGRMACIHVKDRVLYGSVTGKGMYTFNRFSDRTADHFEKHGFEFCGRITVVTDVVRENNGTYRLSFSENAKDGTKMGCGSSEYILLFRKPQTSKLKSYADEPVINQKPLCRNADGELVPYDDELPTEPGTGYSCARWQLDAHGFWRSNGDRLMAPEELSGMRLDDVRRMWLKYSRSHVYNFAEHVQIAEEMEKRGILPGEFMALEVANPGASNVWDDVVRMRTLNSTQARTGRIMHVCPLQIDIVERLIERYSNEGELVCDPFSGLGTVPYIAVLNRRIGYGIELNADYWTDSKSYLMDAERKVLTPTLFDYLEEVEASA